MPGLSRLRHRLPVRRPLRPPPPRVPGRHAEHRRATDGEPHATTRPPAHAPVPAPVLGGGAHRQGRPARSRHHARRPSGRCWTCCPTGCPKRSHCPRSTRPRVRGARAWRCWRAASSRCWRRRSTGRPSASSPGTASRWSSRGPRGAAAPLRMHIGELDVARKQAASEPCGVPVRCGRRDLERGRVRIGTQGVRRRCSPDGTNRTTRSGSRPVPGTSRCSSTSWASCRLPAACRTATGGLSRRVPPLPRPEGDRGRRGRLLAQVPGLELSRSRTARSAVAPPAPTTSSSR